MSWPAAATPWSSSRSRPGASDGFGDPLEAVDAPKRARLWRLAHAWCAQHPDRARGREVRLDVIGITGADPATARLEHLEDVPWV
ncbi:YraN family protein [Microbacterium elymi]|uniref:YraN family protein n=1 Tax=Microbacterium elymi TaxID=2909587 RepID=A0ABY5NNL9_9MICO|nr:YraN family protein [Microbacterium elymi]UUT36728.1 YraN family protein [Microbacterium elymi]